MNFSKGGPSLSIGVGGAKVDFSHRGISETVGMPGTGISYSTFQAIPKRKKVDAVQTAEEAEQIRIFFSRGTFLPPEEGKFAKSVNLMLEGKIDEALDGFNKLLDIADAAFTAAGLYLNRMEYDKALKVIEYALAKHAPDRRTLFEI